MFLYYYVFKSYPSRRLGFIRYMGLVQGLYFFVTGLWPIVDISTFIEVTGPKTDIWLVKMVGALTLAISLLLLIMAKRRHITIESLILILGSCVSYLTIDVYYTINGVISYIYLADAAVQVFLLIMWIQWLIKIRFRLRSIKH